MRGFKLRTVFAWMTLMVMTASLMLGKVWKEYAYAHLSRGLFLGEKDKAQLQNEVMLLETEVHALRQPSRLETLARERFGLVDVAAPIVIEREGKALAREEKSVEFSANENIQAARWGGFAWRIKGW
jgi:hypothetical protein